MLVGDVISLGAPGTFDITDKDNPLYYIARYCHECSLNLKELDDEGFKWLQFTTTDWSDVENDYLTMATSYETWITSAIAASEAGTSIPALPTNLNLTNLVYPESLPVVAINLLIRVFLIWLRGKLDSDTDATEIAQVLKRAFLDEDGEGEEYAIMTQLANTPMEIVISKEDTFQDVTYADRPET